MKYEKLKTLLVISIISAAMMVSSCGYRVYPVSTLEFNYNMNMQTKAEMDAKSHIHIFHSEQDVPCDYELLSYVKSSPAIVIPLIAPEKRQMLKKFYRKAVLKAEKLGGNAIIINGIGDFKVIDAPALNDVEVEEKDVSTLNPIMRSAVLSIFEDGSIYKMTKTQKNKCVQTLQDEIDRSIRACKTHEEAAFISVKIDALEDFFKTEGKDKLVERVVDAYRVALSGAIKKIEAKETKAGKKAGKATDKVKDRFNKLKSKVGIEP